VEKGLKMRRAWSVERGAKKQQGLIIAFTGDGKGKTTAALGTAMRMIRHGKRVAMVQFFKGAMGHGTRATKCERTTWAVDRGSWPGFRVWSFGGGFTWRVAREENARVAQKAWKKCRELLRDPKYSLVIFDEIHIALKYKFLKVPEVVRALKSRRSSQHVILTGRGAPQAMIRLADLVTEMKCVKHPFTRGVLAQPGIEF
jgi:cob(I)alamin adenosyltransferase